MKKCFFNLFYLLFFGCFFSVNVHAQEIVKKEIFSISEPTWIFDAGMSKGKEHDRQDLGFILRENTVLKVRQTNTNFKANLKLRLLGNDNSVEKSMDVGSQWVSISADIPLVPFIDTPYGSVSAQIEYEVVDSKTQKPLPIYEYNKSEQSFFGTWDQYDSEFALVKGPDFQLFIPKKDKEITRNLKDFHSLDEVIDYYTDIFSLYNQIAGFDGSTKENQNGENRYFLKADKSGPGGAFYGSSWAANSEDTVDMWLTKNSWGSLHEIAHGYQAGFDGVGMYTGEVSNNLFGTQYQYSKYGKATDQNGWLFDYGKKERVEKELYDLMMKQDGTYAAASHRQKLILLSLLKQKAGDDSFTKMYQEYRQLIKQPNFKREDYPLPELMNRIYSDNSKQDFTPVLERWGISLEKNQAEKNRFSGYPAVASLADVVPESQLTRARALVDPSYLINSNFEMVRNDEIAALNLAGDLTVQLETENISDLSGIKVRLKDGAKEIASQTIQGKQITFKNVPNGVYHLEFSGAKMKEFIPQNVYVYVKETQNHKTIDMKKIKISNLANQQIDFLGLGDTYFGSLTTNLNDQEVSVSITRESPHVYFVGETYLTISIKDREGNLKYTKNVEGTNAKVEEENISLQKGDVIEIYHAETKNRLTSSEEMIDRTQNINRWVLTDFGLQNQVVMNDLDKKLTEKIDVLGKELIAQERYYPMSLEKSTLKKQLYAAIQHIKNRDTYMTKYGILFR